MSHAELPRGRRPQTYWKPHPLRAAPAEVAIWRVEAVLNEHRARSRPLQTRGRGARPLDPPGEITGTRIGQAGAPRREHHPATIPSRGWCRTRVPQVADRVVERRRGVALARHFRESEGLTIAQIADRLGRSPATIKAYFYDPTGDKARAVKARYQGVCRGCGAYTQPRNGKGDAYAYCKACHPGAIERRWTRERVLDAMREWRAGTVGCRPRTTGQSRTLAIAGPAPSSVWPTVSGRPRRSSPTCSATGRRRAPLHRVTTDGGGHLEGRGAASREVPVQGGFHGEGARRRPNGGTGRASRCTSSL